MNNQDFKQILTQKASEFKLEPNAKAFENILKAKKAQNRKKRLFWVITIAAIFIATYSFILSYNNPNIMNHASSKTEVTFNTNPLKKVIPSKNTKKQIPASHQNKTIELETKKRNDTTKKNEENWDKKTTYKNNATATTERNYIVKHLVTNISELNAFKPNKLLAMDYLNNSLLNNQLTEPVGKLFNSTPPALQPEPTKIDKKNYTKPRFSLSAFNYLMLINNSYNGANNKAIKSNFNISYYDKARSSFSAGLMFGVNYTKFNFSAGLAINKVIFNEVFFTNLQSIGSSQNENLINNFGMALNVIDQSLTFAEIPILAGYNYQLKKWRFNIETGLSLQYLLQTNTFVLEKAQTKTDYIEKTDPKNERFNKLQIGLIATGSVQYHLTNNLLIFGGPIVKLHVNQYYKDEFTKQAVPFYAGLNSGVKIIF